MSKSEKMLLQIIKDKHFAKFDAKFGKRKCAFELSDTCLGTSNEFDKDGKLQWRGRMCDQCLKFKQGEYRAEYRKHRIPKKLGRPVGAKGKKKKESDLEPESD